jgi:hypothetical protein
MKPCPLLLGLLAGRSPTSWTGAASWLPVIPALRLFVSIAGRHDLLAARGHADRVLCLFWIPAGTRRCFNLLRRPDQVDGEPVALVDLRRLVITASGLFAYSPRRGDSRASLSTPSMSPPSGAAHLVIALIVLCGHRDLRAIRSASRSARVLADPRRRCLHRVRR